MKQVIEFVKRETPEDIIGHVFPVLNGETGKYVGICKLSSDLKVDVGIKVVIEEVAPNTGKDSKKLPFIVTEITVLG